MKKNYITMLMALLYASTQLNAQIKDFDLSGYKNNDYQRSSLDFKFDFDQSQRQFSSENNLRPYTNNWFKANGFANINYNYIDFLREKVVLYNAGLNMSGDINTKHEKYDTIVWSSSFASQQTKLWGDYTFQKFYGRSMKNSWKLGGEIQTYVLYQQQDFINNQQEHSYDHKFTPLSIALSIGHSHGRIEEVSVAVKAVYMLDDLSNQGLLARTATESDVTSLADLIRTLEEHRYFDYRIYRKLIMEELVGFFINNSLVPEQSLNLYNVIADYQFYAGINLRSSGRKLSYSVTPSYEIGIWNHSGNKTNPHHYESLLLDIEYRDTKPISLKWHRTYYAGANNKSEWNQNKIGESIISNEHLHAFISAYAGFSFAYLPSTRSYYSASITSSWRQRNMNVSQQNNLDYSLRLSGYYYINERVRLNGDFYVFTSNQNLSYELNGYLKSDSFEQSFKLSLNYFIF
jgi:hypothetical protein